MSKNKLQKFKELEDMNNVLQFPYHTLQNQQFPFKGLWKQNVFKNNNPITLELGCGHGEYTVQLAQLHPDKNFIGVDCKGNRLWNGAKIATQLNLNNARFLRTDIELINHFFQYNEITEIWITFPDPQMKKNNKRLTSARFLTLYQQIIQNNGIVHLKTDSNFLFNYTLAVLKLNNLNVNTVTDDLYSGETDNENLHIQTHYEKLWRSKNIKIKYLQFQCNNTVTITEPNVDIEKDDYKSTGWK